MEKQDIQPFRFRMSIGCNFLQFQEKKKKKIQTFRRYLPSFWLELALSTICLRVSLPCWSKPSTMPTHCKTQCTKNKIPKLNLISQVSAHQTETKKTNQCIKFLGYNRQKFGKPHTMKYIIKQCYVLSNLFWRTLGTTYKYSNFKRSHTGFSIIPLE